MGCRVELGAENGTRTRDPDLGKVVLYQLSYFRLSKGSANILKIDKIKINLEKNNKPRSLAKEQGFSIQYIR